MFDQLGLDLADVLAPWIAILISLSAVFWFKDFAVNLMSGLKFKFNPAFNEGDHIILDGEDAIIVRIGFRETVFGVYSEKGYVWRYISNDRLKLHKLEKIINKVGNKRTQASCPSFFANVPLLLVKKNPSIKLFNISIGGCLKINKGSQKCGCP